MNIPSLPTDNLYKFLAIGGLLLVVVGVVVAEMTVQRESELSTKVVFEMLEEVMKEVELVDATLDRQSGRLDALRDRKPSNDVPVDIAKETAEIREEISGQRAKTRSFREKVFDRRLDLMQSTNEDHARDSRRIVHSCFGLVAVGSVIAIIGFSLWYVRVQRFQDRLIRAEALQAEKELAAPAKAA